jgi:hypothetical protein
VSADIYLNCERRDHHRGEVGAPIEQKPPTAVIRQSSNPLRHPNTDLVANPTLTSRSRGLISDSRIRMLQGAARPDIPAYLRSVVKYCDETGAQPQPARDGIGRGPSQARSHHVAVLVCGPSAMVDSVYAFTEAWARGDLRPARSGHVNSTDASETIPVVQFHVHHETFNL